MLEEALERSGMTQAQLAEVLEVSPGRVSQIFGAESNLTLASVARVLSAMGYEAVVSACPYEGGEWIEPKIRIGRSRVFVDAYHQDYVTGAVTKPRIVFVAAGESPDHPASGPSELIASGMVTFESSARVVEPMLKWSQFSENAADAPSAAGLLQ